MSSKKDDDYEKAHCSCLRRLLLVRVVRVGWRKRKERRESPRQREKCFLFVCQIDFI